MGILIASDGFAMDLSVELAEVFNITDRICAWVQGSIFYYHCIYHQDLTVIDH